MEIPKPQAQTRTWETSPTVLRIPRLAAGSHLADVTINYTIIPSSGEIGNPTQSVLRYETRAHTSAPFRLVQTTMATENI